jgi:hypothetical protein
MSAEPTPEVWVTVNEGRRVHYGDAWHYPGDTFQVPSTEAKPPLKSGDVREADPE